MFIGNKSLVELLNSSTKHKYSNTITKETDFFKNPPPQYPHYPYQLEKDFKIAITTNNIELIKEVCTKINKYPTANLCKSDQVRSLKNNLICNCTLYTRIVLDIGVQDNYAFFLSDAYINKIEELKELSQLNNLSYIMLMDFFTLATSQLQKQHYSSIIKQAIDYIDLNLCNCITLAIVAEAINVNTSYLSRLFKKEVGQNFVEYIHHARISKAKQRLSFSDDSVSSVATEFGYSSYNHFSKVFKKEVGLTPYQFKATLVNNSKI